MAKPTKDAIASLEKQLKQLTGQQRYKIYQLVMKLKRAREQEVKA